MFFGACEPFFDSHEEECFGEKVGAFCGCRESSDGEEIEGEGVRMLGMYEVMVVFSLGRYPLFSGDAGGGYCSVCDFEKEGCFRNIFDINGPLLFIFVGAMRYHVAPGIDEEIFPSIHTYSFSHFVENVSFGDSRKIHRCVEPYHFTPDFEIAFEWGIARGEKFLEYGLVGQHAGKVRMIANVFEN